MKKFGFILLFFAVLLSGIGLSGCKKESPDVKLLEDFPDNLSEFQDFKCVCLIDKKPFLIKDNQAKNLYKKISETQSTKTSIVPSELADKDNITLSFQIGTPMFFGESEKNNAEGDQDPAHYFGVYTIYENDTMSLTAAPFTSSTQSYQLPDGTYQQITELLSESKKE